MTTDNDIGPRVVSSTVVRTGTIAADLVLVACPTCSAQRGERCRRLSIFGEGNPWVEHFHTARWERFRDGSCEDLCMDECIGACGV